MTAKLVRLALSASFAGYCWAQTAPITISPGSLPGGQVGVPYSVTFSATGGRPPYVWSASGAMPSGLGFDAAKATLGGTPQQPGTFDVFIAVNDATGLQARRSYVLTIMPAAPPNPPTNPLTISPPSIPAGQVGVSYFAAFTASGGQPPYMWSISQTPLGLRFDPANAVLSGTPEQPGSYDFAVAVLDGREVRTTQSYRLLIAPAAGPISLTIFPATIPAGQVGVPYSINFTASGGQAPYTWSINQNPPGLQFNTATATLSGAPTSPGAHDFVLTVSGSTGGRTTVTYRLTVTAAPVPLIISPEAVPAGQVGVPYSVTFTAAGGQPPYTWSINQSPQGLRFDIPTATLSGTPQLPSTYDFAVTVSSATGARATRNYLLTVAPAPAGTSLSRTNLVFNAPFNGDPPDPQFVNVTSRDPAARFTTRTDPAAAWLRVTPAAATAPARIIVRVDQDGLAPGSYPAQIMVSGSAQPIQVTLNVRDLPPNIEVSPDYLRLAGTFLRRDQFERALHIRNTGGGGPQPYQIEVEKRSPWIRLSQTSGRAGVRIPDVVRVSIDTSSLGVGFHRDNIRVTSGSRSESVPVGILVLPDGPVLGLNPNGFQFEARQGNGTSVSRNLQIQNLSSGTLTWSAEILQGRDWLTLGTAQGTATQDVPGTLAISTNTAALAAGQYYGLIRVNAPGAQNSPQLFPITLNVAAANSPAQAAPSPSGLLFTAVSGGAAPPTQAVRVFTSSQQRLTFLAGTATEDSTGWLGVNQNTGFTDTGNPGEVAVRVDPANLSPGVYKGEVGITLADNTVRTVNLTFVVTPRPLLATAAEGGSRVPGCTPRELVATHTGLISNFSTAVGWPTPLTVRVGDDCAEPVVNANVVVTFSNGDPPLALTLNNAAQGTYTGTWTPGRVAAEIGVTARVTSPGLIPASATIHGGSRETKAPIVFPNGLVHNLNPQRGAPVAPGTVAAVFGSDLASVTQSPGVIPLPTSFAETSILVGGVEAPLYFLSNGQVNIQVPSELRPNQSYQVIVSANGALSVPERIAVTPVQPGVAAFADGRVIAQHADFSLVDASRPARPDEVILLYLAGLGETTPRVATGQLSPAAQLVTPATVTVDGRPATIHYAGLTPGGIGLYQINVQIPADAPDGDLPLVVRQGDIEANTVTVPVRRQ
jgi:uncharacterized protein (TIGR03437 family)